MRTPTLRQAIERLAAWFDRKNAKAVRAFQAGRRDHKAEFILWTAGGARQAAMAGALSWDGVFSILRTLRRAYIRRCGAGALSYEVTVAEEWVAQRAEAARAWRREPRHWTIVVAGTALRAAREGHLTGDEALEIFDICKAATERLDREAEAKTDPPETVDEIITPRSRSNPPGGGADGEVDNSGDRGGSEEGAS